MPQRFRYRNPKWHGFVEYYDSETFTARMWRATDQREYPEVFFVDFGRAIWPQGVPLVEGTRFSLPRRRDYALVPMRRKPLAQREIEDAKRWADRMARVFDLAATD